MNNIDENDCVGGNPMGEKKENIQDLIQKIDELLNVLKVIAGDLTSVSNSLKKVNESTTSTMETDVSGKNTNIKEVMEAFSVELREMLLFEKSGNNIIVKPKRFLGSDNFAKIASIIRELGGEYISAGRDSHFNIVKK